MLRLVFWVQYCPCATMNPISCVDLERNCYWQRIDAAFIQCRARQGRRQKSAPTRGGKPTRVEVGQHCSDVQTSLILEQSASTHNLHFAATLRFRFI